MTLLLILGDVTKISGDMTQFPGEMISGEITFERLDRYLTDYPVIGCPMEMIHYEYAPADPCILSER